MMRRFGLIGYPLTHSFSEGYFAEKFERLGLANNHIYKAYPLPQIEDLPALLTDPELRGLNVTIPYKQAVIPFLDKLDPAAAEIGAVNTIAIREGRLKGYNTDVIGFSESLKKFLSENGGPAHQALILGTGGAAKAVAWTLLQAEVISHYVSRRSGPDRLTYAQVNEQVLKTYDLIVNTTPLGTFPAAEGFPDLPYHALSERHRLYDLVYNPAETVFLRKGREQGAATQNGLAMLHGQAEASWAIWNDSE